MTRDTARPYCRHSIAELEALFGHHEAKLQELRALDWELSHRTTDRAARLRRHVTRVLATFPSCERRDGATAPAIGSRVVKSVEGKAAEKGAVAVKPSAAPDAIPPIIELGEALSSGTPAGLDEPGAILAAWTALEALAPQTYRRPEDLAAGDRACVANFSNGDVPWTHGERSRPKKQLYYQVVLGSIRIDQATADLVAAFGGREEQSSRAKEKAVIGALLVDRNGVVSEENGIAVSSFSWALPLALRRKLGSLGTWETVEAKVIEQIEKIVRRVDDEGHPIPLDLPTVHRVHRWLVAQFDIPRHLIEPPGFALRVYHYFKAANPPEPLLLNSFFLRDLARSASMVERRTAPAGLQMYLGIEKPAQTFDLLTDIRTLEEAIAPAMMPAARWPGPGGHPLVTLQQAAVNLARAELLNKGGVVAVNGPPGTGKTTLLRDVVASCVLDRALAMAAFDDPAQAFTPSGEKVKAGENAFFHLYALAPELKGHEVLVASSNNKAVENVSKELPTTGAVGWEKEHLHYFSCLSDFVYRSREQAADDGDQESPPDTIETWGMIAAVLGNAQNRAAFQRAFWWDPDCGFRWYLKAAKGDSVVREITDPETGAIERHTPRIVVTERPPSPQQAKVNWRAAKERLLTLTRAIQADLAALEQVRQSCQHLARDASQIENLEASLAQLAAEQASLVEKQAEQTGKATSAHRGHLAHARRVQAHRKNRPGFLACFFKTERANRWAREHAPLMQAEASAAAELRAAKRELSTLAARLDNLEKRIQKTNGRLTSLRKQVRHHSANINAHRPALGNRLVDASFFTHAHDVWNLAAPWIPDDLHRKREELFVAALAVHRAFIDAAAKKILHNLSVLMGVFASGSPGDEAKRRLLGDLWSTLFLVVPVISTTFASVDRMLGDLPAESIGWLLIDEAGQAIPQAAVGAIMRAQRSIIVGDPLQIPPVVTLPDRLASEICRFFKVETSRWAAPDASAQTLGDHASRYQAAFRSDRGPRIAGIPLLVHRRCDEPMFGISNRIAYDGQMVQAIGSRAVSAIGRVLGPSAWFDVDGDAESKWCPTEGEFAVKLMTTIADAGITEPDLFMITPFRIVAHELRRRLAREERLFTRLGVNGMTWRTHRVGTIHTVQGREADTVVLILGAPKASQHGARNWAGAIPNILNVAVSRGKQRLYVIGAYGAWCGVGHMSDLSSAVSRIRV